MEENKKPLVYRIDLWDSIISKHINQLIPKKQRTIEQKIFDEKIAKETDSVDRQMNEWINKHETDPVGAEFDQAVENETAAEFPALKQEFLVKAILYCLTDGTKELDEDSLHSDLTTRVIASHPDVGVQTLEQDQVLNRLLDFKNYIRDVNTN
ncbi:hypothetical protein GRZ59_15175 [Lactobacillus paracasei]|uniref:hypothetical protein n=1 Tax=Lacticaseibacillus paracasei TaxID=1597 RepID=UPI00136C5C59|nr:hypothetical protein [Lacticaseibacillus paracasei]MXI85009.1 hypothetical protein [Lacticaseibacillus paracasei]